MFSVSRPVFEQVIPKFSVEFSLSVIRYNSNLFLILFSFFNRYVTQSSLDFLFVFNLRTSRFITHFYN
nr:MAG TPA: hypothetical protein [Caudoviricetes sp.]